MDDGKPWEGYRDTLSYIGDGVYTWFDGYQVWVAADRYGVWHYVALERETMAQLIRYARQHYGE